jgi:tripartite-type tricarboxylate transporter receptor subunit TctC
MKLGNFRRASLLIGACAVTLVLSASARAFPDQRVLIVVPVSPGGPTDLLPRMVAPELTQRWGQPVVVENRTGAGGLIGTQAVVRAKPDGYTLLSQGNFVSAARLFMKDMDFDPARDLRGVGQFGWAYYLVLTNPAVPARTIAEFIELARAKPKALNYGTIPFSGYDLDYVRLQRLAGISMTPVPFPGAAPAILALIRNDTQFYFGTVLSASPALSDGRLRALAIAGRQRSEQLPGVPTLIESGVDFTGGTWYGLLAPAKAPDEAVAEIASALAAALKTPAIASKVKELGFAPPTAASPREFDAQIQSEAKTYSEFAAELGIKPQ